MTTFDDRERAAEARWAGAAETEFRVLSRAKRALAVWAAQSLGQQDGAAEITAQRLLQADLEGHLPVPEAVVRLLAGHVTRTEIESHYQHLLDLAHAAEGAPEAPPHAH
ncbi:DUF1476 domain-containing protein [Pseudooceanicola sp. CBS1P-1]|uniref:DUF1476 family protein n=1 Tax=Pseudooceanicola albus TaxID=2692189 RepID=A0A6L7G1B8_9RHOB|nr:MULTISPECIES: ATPase inhibitor subunit zeta [Pseudooceanicola]MBT9383637.1 DUF1476 domain-containing protein [Pseudooceanicola endophyticus]MXN17492.1 DUF1476 family protein [Pseudooceanicola albus]